MKVSIVSCAWCSAKEYPDFVISDTAWQRVVDIYNLPQGSLCPICVNARLEVLGMRNIAIRFKSGAFVQE